MATYRGKLVKNLIKQDSFDENSPRNTVKDKGTGSPQKKITSRQNSFLKFLGGSCEIAKKDLDKKSNNSANDEFFQYEPEKVENESLRSPIQKMENQELAQSVHENNKPLFHLKEESKHSMAQNFRNQSVIDDNYMD